VGVGWGTRESRKHHPSKLINHIDYDTPTDSQYRMDAVGDLGIVSVARGTVAFADPGQDEIAR
jgi:hypothetical protein